MIENDPAIRSVCSFSTLRCFPSGAMEVDMSKGLKRSLTQSVCSACEVSLPQTLPLDSDLGHPITKEAKKAPSILAFSTPAGVCCPTEEWICVIISLSFTGILTGAFLVAAFVSSKLELQGSLSTSPQAQETFLYSSKVTLLLPSVYFTEVVQEPLHNAACLTLSHRSWPAALIPQSGSYRLKSLPLTRATQPGVDRLRALLPESCPLTGAIEESSICIPCLLHSTTHPELCSHCSHAQVHTWQYHLFIHEWIAKGWLSKSWTRADSSVFQRHPRQYNCSGNAHLQAFFLLPQVTNFLDLSLTQPPSWESPSTHPLSAMPGCLFFASWGSDLWCCKVSVKTCLLTVCPCSWCTSLPALSCSSFHWRSSTSGRAPLLWVRPPPLLQHQREVPSISYSPSPGWWNPLPEVCLGQGSGILRAIASAVSGSLCFTTLLPEFSW